MKKEWTDEAEELRLWVLNEYQIYKNLEEVHNCLYKKFKTGKYRSELATKAFMNVCNIAAKYYCKVFGGVWNKEFTPDCRKAVAKELQEVFEYEVIPYRLKEDKK